jgi:ATP-binding protein involved in chromosome partitioning
LTLVEEKLLIMSGKGGVNEITLAISLTVGLSETASKADLMDVDLDGPDIPKRLVFQGEGQSYEN